MVWKAAPQEWLRTRERHNLTRTDWRLSCICSLSVWRDGKLRPLHHHSSTTLIANAHLAYTCPRVVYIASIVSVSLLPPAANMPSRKRSFEAVDGDSEDAAPQLLHRIRNMWQFANLCQWIYIFGKVAKIDESIDIEARAPGVFRVLWLTLVRPISPSRLSV